MYDDPSVTKDLPNDHYPKMVAACRHASRCAFSHFVEPNSAEKVPQRTDWDDDAPQQPEKELRCAVLLSRI
jgi:hypothetical protein